MKPLGRADEGAWRLRPQILQLADNEIHVWRASLDAPSVQVAQYERMLARDELARAQRFVFEKDCARFIVGRGILRVLLGYYLNREPSELEFSYGNRAKPTLARKGNDTDIRFNVSHSDGLALFGFTAGRNIGIDVERIRSGFASDEIAERFFAPGEINALRSLPAEMQDEAFFGFWTLKESYIKATGEGLSLPLDQFDVTEIYGNAHGFVGITGSVEKLPWALVKIDAGPGYAAAVAVQGDGWQVRFWHWDE